MTTAADSGKKGGLMTIRPPAKVKTFDTDSARVLASNIDKLDLAVHIRWFDGSFFEVLAQAKAAAVACGQPLPLVLKPAKGTEAWKGMIKPHGANGYAWLIDGLEFTFKIGNWIEPINRPSVMVEIRSETLWRLSPEAAVQRILDILQGQGKGCIIQSVKPSRIDMCIDILMPASMWKMELVKYRVTRANHAAIYLSRGDRLSGISIGKGNFSARLYDKPLEIIEQSGKNWMYAVWGIEKNALAEDQVIVRVEFQLRRQALVELGIDTIDDALNNLPSIWGYLTQKWLKFRTRPGLHHTQRQTFQWWKVVQDGFRGVHKPKPLLRFKAHHSSEMRLLPQLDGLITTLDAMALEAYDPEGEVPPDRDIAIDLIRSALDSIGKDNIHHRLTVEDKRAKFKRSEEKALAVHKERDANGFPSQFLTTVPMHQKTIEEATNG